MATVSLTGVVTFDMMTTTGGYFPLSTNVRLPEHRWTHVALSYDTSNLHIYFNGIEVARRAVSGTMVSSSFPLVFGRYLSGSLDEVRVYRRALSAGEIAADLRTPIDVAAPFAVTRITPAANTLGILTTPITAAFSHALNASTLTVDTFELRDAGNAVVPGSFSYDASQRIAILTPTNALAPSSTYTARVVGGSKGVKDSADVALPSDTVWTFVTAAVNTVPSLAPGFSEGTGTTTLDRSGNGNNGTFTQSLTWTAGQYGSAVQFAGNAAELQVPPSDTLTLSSEFTFEAWVKPTAFGDVDFGRRKAWMARRCIPSLSDAYRCHFCEWILRWHVLPTRDDHSDTAVGLDSRGRLF
jgi:hypothetical protein